MQKNRCPRELFANTGIIIVTIGHFETLTPSRGLIKSFGNRGAKNLTPIFRTPDDVVVWVVDTGASMSIVVHEYIIPNKCSHVNEML